MKKKDQLVEINIEGNHAIYYKALEYLDSFCSSYGINYFLLWGSLLGAVRNGEMIPWDDDVDVGMSWEDLSKFISLENDFDCSRYKISTFRNTKKAFSNVCHILIQNFYFTNKNESKKQIKNVVIDIFVFDETPPDKREILGRYKKLRKISNLLYYKYPHFGSSSRFAGFVRLFLSKLFLIPTGKHLHKKFEKIATKYNGTNQEYIFFPDVAYSGHFFFHPKHDFSVIRVKFGPIMTNIPTGYLSLLEMTYGKDWRTPVKRQSGPNYTSRFFVGSGFSELNKEYLINYGTGEK